LSEEEGMSEEQAPRGVFVINGEPCPFPDLGEGFTMAEAMVFYDYTGFPIEELFAGEDENDEELERKRRSPGVLAALMHLAYQRAHPKAPPAAVKKLVQATDMVSALASLAAALEEEDAERPPEEAPKSEPRPSSPTSSDSSSASSGDASGNGSAPPDDPPSPTTTFESDTSVISGQPI
jgi:hypothetical protein